MEPITTVTSALTIAKTAGELIKKLIDFGKGLSDRNEKRQVEEMLVTLRDLKQSASELEDQNRELREKLRFKSDDYVFLTPFRYHQDRLDQPLCVKCFAKNVEAQMGEEGVGCTQGNRSCLVCGDVVEVSQASDSPQRRRRFPA